MILDNVGTPKLFGGEKAAQESEPDTTSEDLWVDLNNKLDAEEDADQK